MSPRPAFFYRALLFLLELNHRRQRRQARRGAGPVDRAAALAALRRATGRPSFPVCLSSLQIRDWADIRIPGGGETSCRARLYRPRGRIGGLVLFLHGGGFVHCDLVSHHGICCRLARQSGAMVVSLDYRLAPEHPFPAAVEDCRAACDWVAEMGRIYDLPVALAGDSAGGNLAAVTAAMMRDAGRHDLAAQLLYYPALTGSLAPDSRALYAEGYMLTMRIMEWYVNQYLLEADYLSHPHFAPALAERFERLPPTMVVTAEFDPLRGEGEIYHARLKAAGVPSRYVMVRGAIHGFLNFYAATRDGRRAIRQGALFLRQTFRQARGAASDHP